MWCCWVLVPVTAALTLLVAQSLPERPFDGRSPFCDEPDEGLRRWAELVYWGLTAALTAGVVTLREFWDAVARAGRFCCLKLQPPEHSAADQVRRRKRDRPPYTSVHPTPPQGRMTQ